MKLEIGNGKLEFLKSDPIAKSEKRRFLERGKLYIWDLWYKWDIHNTTAFKNYTLIIFMKSNKISIVLLIISSFISCNNEDDNPKQEQEIINPCEKLYKKQTLYELGSPTFINEVFYDSASRIDSISQFDVTTDVSIYYKVSYEENVISKIQHEIIYNFNPTLDQVIVYDDIDITNSNIILNSSNSERKIEINYTDIYVDKTKEYYSQNPPSFSEQTFSRNGQNQIISNTAFGNTYSYSNHVNGENNDLVGIGIINDLPNILLIFKLRISSSTPLTLGMTDLNIEFENNSCIIKSIKDENRYKVYEYINP